MKIGLDFHGVITHRPELWKFINTSIMNNGGEVHIITGGTLLTIENPIIKQLAKWGIPYTEIHSVYDYLKKTGAPTIEGVRTFPDGTIQTKYDDEVWDRVKGEMSSRLGIHLHIDDTPQYGRYFNDIPFILYNPKWD
jgi:hypothetical protein